MLDFTEMMTMMSKMYLPDHGCTVDSEIMAICGNIAEFDYGSGYSYRCTDCNATIGSICMPSTCRDIMEQDKIADKLKGNKNVQRKM